MPVIAAEANMVKAGDARPSESWQIHREPRTPLQRARSTLACSRVGRGKCVPNWMVEANGFVKRLLQRSSCESGSPCVPCFVATCPGVVHRLRDSVNPRDDAAHPRRCRSSKYASIPRRGALRLDLPRPRSLDAISQTVH